MAKEKLDNILLETFVKCINDISATKNVSQADIARALKVSTTTVSRWFTGTCFPSMDKLFELEKILGCDLHLFFGKQSESQFTAKEIKIIEAYRVSRHQASIDDLLRINEE